MKPLSLVDQIFLWLERRQQPMHVAGLQLFEFPEEAGPEYVTELADFCKAFTQPTAPFDKRLYSRWGRFYWGKDPQFDLEHHFRHEALPKPGRIRELLALVSAEHSHLMDRERPLWQAHLIEGFQDRRFALYSKIHHSLTDGVSAMRMAQRALSTNPNQRNMPPPWAQNMTRKPHEGPVMPTDVIGSLRHLLEDVTEQVSTIPGVVSALYRTIRDAQEHPDYGLLYDAPPCILNQKITGSRRFAAQSWSLERLKTIGKAFDATLNDVVLAQCASALRAYLLSQNALPEKPLVAMVPMNLRQDDGIGGNQIGMIITSLATHIEDPAARLLAIQDSIQACKDRFASMTPAEIVNYTALTLAPAGIQLLTGMVPKLQTFNVIISNVPGPREPLYWNGARLQGMYPVSIVLDRMALNITLTSYADQLEFGLIGCRRTLPSLQRLLDYLENGLLELEAAAGITSATTRKKGRSRRKSGTA
ncbi:MAG: wax ester/triacylglycerol synthase family O-acyltransferase [Gammaproteobacteria bacterium]|nr:MAG: wax ester/triacylglycerol synthase family O-acyltransferase [Gammaproteobacteria bacterium]